MASSLEEILSKPPVGLQNLHRIQQRVFSTFDMGWPDLLSKLAVVMMMMIDNLVSPMISPR
jgi:hypothetical protein